MVVLCFGFSIQFKFNRLFPACSLSVSGFLKYKSAIHIKSDFEEVYEMSKFLNAHHNRYDRMFSA